METVTSETDSSVVTRFSPARRAYEAIYLIFAVICALLILRIIMKLLAASTAAGFTGFVYGVTDVFMAPFRGLLPVFASGRNVFDFSAIIALLVYVLIGFLLSRLVAIIFMRDVTVAQRRRGRYRPY
jgi:uncharacterized protein YggT (Ycf19 family)